MRVYAWADMASWQTVWAFGRIAGGVASWAAACAQWELWLTRLAVAYTLVCLLERWGRWCWTLALALLKAAVGLVLVSALLGWLVDYAPDLGWWASVLHSPSSWEVLWRGARRWLAQYLVDDGIAFAHAAAGGAAAAVA